MAILIIDDCKDTQMLIKKFLEDDCKANLVFADSGQAGIETLNDEIELILLDIVMPGKDGIETCKEIKSMTAYKDIPIIIVTQHKEIDVLEKAFAAGASDFIGKPFNRIELRARVCSMMMLSKEMKKRQEKELELTKLSTLDGLTGVSNRRYFDQMLEREMGTATRNGTPLSLILFDVDFFKRYNDRYGHLAGDEALKAIAEVSRQQLKRPADIVCRYGGEEFVVLLPDTRIDGAFIVAEEMRRAIEALQLPHEDSEISEVLTVSLGVAELTDAKAETPSMLIKHADAALYHAKNNGRNKTVSYNKELVQCSFLSNTCEL
ncbi:GGDEF domain-containing response regulator [Desulfuribacillus alkaliarsenatis]|uniref:Diguanylate cyclase response regulator n=1 Tax=Desulfuribacillus alkaliarsenatis TaxID=766136 RepID=A0A1E5G1N6_9FIRM|nr:diguanylate cyclase [Desulfuribacillus alkaliarsenatis]OEF96742.1 hypothetical protein BHF68_06625 [Desulfuribacillus alkaliarsenatis]